MPKLMHLHLPAAKTWRIDTAKGTNSTGRIAAFILDTAAGVSRKLLIIGVSSIVLFIVAVGVIQPNTAPVYAADPPFCKKGEVSTVQKPCKETEVDVLQPLPKVSADSNKLQVIFSIVLGVMAAFALLVMTIGGLRFVLSRGNPQSTAQAKNTIIYALIGLIVIMSAFSIVTFVLGGL